MTSEGPNTGPAGSGAPEGSAAACRCTGPGHGGLCHLRCSRAGWGPPPDAQDLRTEGLLGPARTLGGSRRYSDKDIELLRRIGDLTSGGLNLEG